jgi:hypothetical protein
VAPGAGWDERGDGLVRHHDHRQRRLAVVG